jgi:hypothetical protein
VDPAAEQDPAPEGQKLPTKIEKSLGISCFEALGVLFRELINTTFGSIYFRELINTTFGSIYNRIDESSLTVYKEQK